MADETMMTKLEFQESLRAWGDAAKASMQRVLKSKTHGSGALGDSLKVVVSEDSKTSSHSVGFKFNRYGVYVAYGVGRGWIHENGSVVKGKRTVKKTELTYQLLKRGYTKKEISQMSFEGEKKRKPVDWFDSVLDDRIEDLGTIASQYYSDFSMGDLLESFSRMRINSNYNIKLHGKQ